MVKNKFKPLKGKKLVRIDAKTHIEVDEDIPDEVAIAEFYEKVGDAHKRKLGRPKNTGRKPKGSIS